MLATLKRLKQRRAQEGLEGGFTLIELLIVIVVLGILAAVVVLSLGGVTSKSAQAACQADGATVSTAMAAYNAQNGANPPTDAALTANALGGPYLQSWPSNFTHYAYGIVSGVLYIEVPGDSTWSTTPASGGTLATGIAFTGPSQCATVS